MYEGASRVEALGNSAPVEGEKPVSTFVDLYGKLVIHFGVLGGPRAN